MEVTLCAFSMISSSSVAFTFQNFLTPRCDQFRRGWGANSSALSSAMGTPERYPQIAIGNKEHARAAVVIIGAGLSGESLAIDYLSCYSATAVLTCGTSLWIRNLY